MHSYITEQQTPSTAQVLQKTEYQGNSLSGIGVTPRSLNDFFQTFTHIYTLLSLQTCEKTSADIHNQNEKNLPITVKDIYEEVRSTFGINALQLAKLAGVSRATLYNHINGSEAPKSLDRYNQLYEAALAVRNVAPGGVKSGLKNVLVDGKTLLSHLKSNYSDPKKIADIAYKVTQMQPTKSSSHLSLEEKKHEIRRISKQG